jgi:hypothetical protein
MIDDHANLDIAAIFSVDEKSGATSERKMA